jgi:hypothetical protein
MDQISANQGLKHVEEFVKNRNISPYEESEIEESLSTLGNKTPWSNNQAPSHLNPNNLRNLATLRAWGLPEGQSADSMLVGENEYGEKVFITNTSEYVPGLEEEFNTNTIKAERSAIFLSGLGFSVPEHYYCDEFLAVKECQGQPLDESDNPCISKHKFLKFASGQMLIGNEDSRPCNIFVHNGELVPVDLKMAGRFIGDYSILRDTLLTLFESAIAVEVYNRDEESEFISDLRQQLKRTVQERPTERAVDDVAEVDCSLSGLFADNINMVRKNELISEDRKKIYQ